MDFLILRPLSPKTGYHFFEGVGGGLKVFAQKAPSSGETHYCNKQAWSNGNAANHRFLDQRDSCWVDCRRRRRPHVRPTGVRTADQKSLRAAALPFSHYLHCRSSSSPLLTAEYATDNKPKLCVSV